MGGRRRGSLPGALAVATAVVLSVTLLPATAVAAPVVSDRARAAACDDSAVSARTSGRAADGPTYTARQLRRIDRRLTEALDGRRLSTARTGLVLRIPVHVHVIRNRTVRGPSIARIRGQLAVLNDAFAGGQSVDNTSTRFSFRLASYQRVRNNAWHRAALGSREDFAMRRKLHKGGPEALNLYVLRPRAPMGQGIILGWSSAVWDARRRTALDGITLHQESLPGGSLRSYDEGDSLVHEAGHWLGLLHTFEGGCSEPNDLVEDTPAHPNPTHTCDAGQDTCDLPGEDPVRNFMNYADDGCMDMFTPGQVSRMTDNWLAYRTP
jgi:hypothetical protein